MPVDDAVEQIWSATVSHCPPVFALAGLPFDGRDQQLVPFEEYKGVIDGHKLPLSAQLYTEMRSTRESSKRRSAKHFRARQRFVAFDDGRVPKTAPCPRICGPVCLNEQTRAYLKMRTSFLEMLRVIVVDETKVSSTNLER